MPGENRYKIEYLPVAQEDLLQILGYIAKNNPPAAKDVIDKLDRAISGLVSFPLIGAIPKDERLKRLGYRMLIVEKYLVFYVVKDEVIEIRRVLHGSRKYEFLL